MFAARESITSTMSRGQLRREAVTLLAVFLAAMFLTIGPTAAPAGAGGGPMIIVQVHTPVVAGHGWQPNSQVMITIDALWSSGTVDIAVTASTDGSGSFNVPNVGYFLSPQDIVTVEDGIRTKELVVADVWGAESNEAANTVSGLASPNEEIRTWVAGYRTRLWTRRRMRPDGGRSTTAVCGIW